jgi:two-component system, cell cycle sensor histidine kinase and response regulator CckA
MTSHGSSGPSRRPVESGAGGNGNISPHTFRSMVESASRMMLLCDPEWAIRYVNPQGLVLTGYTEKEVLGRTLNEFVKIDEFERIKNIAGTLRHGTSFDRGPFEVLFLHRGGDTLAMEADISPVFDAGALKGFMFSACDSRERRRMDEEVLKNKKLESIGLLAGGIAHDYNNLLTAVMGYMTLAEAHLKTHDEALALLSRARHAVNMAKDLSRKLITFSKGGKPVRRRNNVPPLLRNTLSFALIGSNIECEFDLAPDLWQVEYDESQMSQAIHNIAINAREAMPQGGKVRVEAENAAVRRANGHPVEPGDWVRITIKDNGPGIPGNHLDRIFDPYFSTKEMCAQKGLGLGLAITHSVVSKHNGVLLAESEPGRGTSMHIYLPACNSPKRREHGTEPAGEPEGPVRILVMDDEEVVREITARMLIGAGYEVGLARDGDEALRLFNRCMQEGNPFQVALLDLTVRGGMGGKEVIGKLLEIEPRLKALVSSGYPEDPVMIDFTDYGFCGAAMKPSTMDELVESIRKVL